MSRIDDEYTIFDAIEEAAYDLINPLIDSGVYTGSQFSVRDLARAICRRAFELFDHAEADKS